MIGDSGFLSSTSFCRNETHFVSLTVYADALRRAQSHVSRCCPLSLSIVRFPTRWLPMLRERHPSKRADTDGSIEFRY